MLYLVKSGNYLKVGFSNNIENREDSYNTDNPDFEFIHTRDGDRKDESYLHKILSSKIHHREWMLYDDYIIYLFKNIVLPSEITENFRKDYNKVKNKLNDLQQKYDNLQIDYNELYNTYNKELKQIVGDIRELKRKIKEHDELIKILLKEKEPTKYII